MGGGKGQEGEMWDLRGGAQNIHRGLGWFDPASTSLFMLNFNWYRI